MGSASRTAQITRSDFHGKGVGTATWTILKNEKFVERRCGLKKKKRAYITQATKNLQH